ncbi:uncharacterized protein LOC110982319 [Acanthaster planci]|uniref:Uncharacterized protein LOC110982319 n=1 Tax=Acanthaster planci TaxID=133434 RepID=A0A8B7YUG5_ACAPL|nr:uncharacterized protein LOC110982319 [Acanthaster planci]
MSASTFLGALVVVLAVIPSGQAFVNPQLRDILKINVDFKNAVEVNDLDSIMKLYKPDVLFLPEGHPGFTGKDKLAENLSWVSSAGKYDYYVNYLDYLSWKDGLVMELKTFTLYDKSENKLFEGKALLLWQLNKYTGTFEISLEMFNSNKKGE